MRLAIFGGTFDPIHTGHLLMAEAARVQCRLDRVLFLPTGRPPLKAQPLAAPAHRLAMVRKAIARNPHFAVSAWEIRQRRRVYTYETLAYFKTRYPRADLFFILGSDALRDVPRWRQGAALLGQGHFLAVERPAALWPSLAPALRRRVTRVQSPLCAIASHTVRAQVARGASVRYQVPDAVAAYIQSRRLYKRKSR